MHIDETSVGSVEEDTRVNAEPLHGTTTLSEVGNSRVTLPKDSAPDAPENRRAEYEALRAEILYSDQVCMIITGALLSGSLALLTFAVDTLDQPDIAALLSPVWLIGYSYISEKRFVIETIASYTRQHVETQSGFGWERWLRDEQQGRTRFPRVFTFHLETIISVIAVLALPLFLLLQNDWHVGWGFFASLLFVPLIIYTAYRNLRAYDKRTED